MRVHNPFDMQQAIVAEIEAEQQLVAANRELIACFEKKIQATLARVWREETADVGAEQTMGAAVEPNASLPAERDRHALQETQ